ncbi:MAG TPA: AMP-binding protein, partial [Casimicrobiaceae bacterium]|nr:AMP-binding protein [Casimicrobiaceae bacterium]
MSPDDRRPVDESSIAARLLTLIAAMLAELRPASPAPPVALDDALDHDLGLDSLSRAELLVRVERAFGVTLPDHLAGAARTPRALAEAIATAKPKGPPVALVPAPVPPPAIVAGTPDAATTLVDAFRWHVERHPDREHITLLEGDEPLETMTYAHLWDAACDVAAGLAAAGVGRGDKVALMLPTGSAFFHAFLGSLLAGAVPVPLYPPLRWSEIEEHVRGRAAILGNSEARILLTVPEAMVVGRIARALLPTLRAVTSVERLRGTGTTGAIVQPHCDETAMLQYTSGSTGDPKGVVLSHRNLLANLRVMGPAAAATSRDRFLSWLPLYHDMGLIGAWLTTMYFAVPLVLMSPANFLARPSRWLCAIHRYGATISAGPNFAYEIAATKIHDDEIVGLDLSGWRLAFNGAEPVRAATLERFASRFARYGFDARALTPVYGLAESAVGLAFPPLGRGPRVDRIDPDALSREGVARVAGADLVAALDVVSCGAPLPGHELRVVDDEGRETPERVEGRVEFRGPSATAGYYRNPAATRRLFRGDWLDTGDIGYVAGGELFLTTRAKDMIKRGGHNIHPYDLEAAVGDIPGIRKGCVAVFGTTDRASGTERVVVVAETNHTDAASQAALRGRIMALADVHLNGPADEVLLVPARTVLKTSSGKIRRAACRELYEHGLLRAPRRAVWLQMARLGVQAARASSRRGAGALLRTAYGAYAWSVALGFALLALPVIVLAPALHRRLRIARASARLLLRACGIRLSVDGTWTLSPGQAAVIVVNHASYADALVVLATVPCSAQFVAKREFVHAPLFGALLRRLGTRFVERSDPEGGIEDARGVLDVVQAGATVAFFPEGTFSRRPGLAAFRLGAFSVSAAAGVPVVPVTLQGTRSLLREGRWLPNRGPVAVRLGVPVVPDG